MKANLRQVRKSRIYSDEFKKEIVGIFEKGELSVLQLEKLYGVSDVSIYNWIYKYSNFNEKGFRVIEMKDSVTSKLKELSAKVKQLEGIVGQKQIKIDYLEKLIEISENEFDIDIKKKQNTSQSAGLGKTKRN